MVQIQTQMQQINTLQVNYPCNHHGYIIVVNKCKRTFYFNLGIWFLLNNFGKNH